jgi:hypothetical protein
MTNDIEPALNADEWAKETAIDDRANGVTIVRHEHIPAEER